MSTQSAPATPERERVPSCPVCGYSDRAPWGTVRDHEFLHTDQRFPAERCDGCGAIFLSERLRPEAMGILYPDDYHPYEKGVSGPGRSAGWRRLVARVRRRLEVPKALESLEARMYEPRRKDAVFLDYGCGSAAFLDRARADGWTKTIGVDFTETVAARVRAAGHEAFTVESLCGLPDDSVDAVRMNHVLEHLTSPDDALREVRRVLRPEGRLHVAVPNPGGVGATVFKTSWRAAEPRHLVLYGPAVLHEVLVRNGFRVEVTAHEPSPRDLVGSACYALEDRRLIGRPTVDRLRQHPILELATLPLASLAALARRGERIHVLAFA